MSGLIKLATNTVKPEWTDYNNHMNVAYYTLAFDIALDEFYEDHFKRCFLDNGLYVQISRKKQSAHASSQSEIY